MTVSALQAHTAFDLQKSKALNPQRKGKPMKTELKMWLLSAACALAACLPLTGQAEPYFASKDGSMIWDKATNLV